VGELAWGVLRELLDYDAGSGIFTWRQRDRSWFKSDKSCQLWNARDSGKRAGCIQRRKRNGYRSRHIRLLGKSYMEHRLAWMWMMGEMPKGQIDHINRDATDNRWSNLKQSTCDENSKNHSMRANNSSGVTGVYWKTDAGKWCAVCGLGGKSHHLGYFDDIEEAAKVVTEFRCRHGFSPGHGVRLAHYHNQDDTAAQAKAAAAKEDS